MVTRVVNPVKKMTDPLISQVQSAEVMKILLWLEKDIFFQQKFIHFDCASFYIEKVSNE